MTNAIPTRDDTSIGYRFFLWTIVRTSKELLESPITYRHDRPGIVLDTYEVRQAANLLLELDYGALAKYGIKVLIARRENAAASLKAAVERVNKAQGAIEYAEAHSAFLRQLKAVNEGLAELAGKPIPYPRAARKPKAKWTDAIDDQGHSLRRAVAKTCAEMERVASR